jgi:hypothetical protein
MSCSRRRRITRPSLCAGITTVVTTQHYERQRRPRAAIDDAPGDYFRGYRERSPKYPRVYPDIQAGLLRSITRNPAACGISAIRHQTLPSRLDAWLLPARSRADRRRRSLRIGEGRHLSLVSMWIVNRNSCHLLPKPLKPCESRPISGQREPIAQPYLH